MTGALPKEKKTQILKTEIHRSGRKGRIKKEHFKGIKNKIRK